MIVQAPKKKRSWASWLCGKSRWQRYGRDALLVFLLTCCWTYSRQLLNSSILNDSIISLEPSFNQQHQQRIVMVTYTFGTATPLYTQMFCESARHSGIDVVMVGTPAPPFSLPPNVRYVPFTWEQFVGRVSNRLFQGQALPNLSNASRYKVIDFKPAFAFLFPELVDGYDWFGHLDNDMLLGNIRHFITNDILEQYDWIPGIPPKSASLLKNWGPFTLYRNSKQMKELFLLASNSLSELYDTQEPLFLDEWGELFPSKSPYWNSTMSGILSNNYKRLGIRVWDKGFPLVWDGSCKRREQRCAECTLNLTSSAQPQRLTVRVANENCALEEECLQEEVLLCHYQRSKKTLEASLRTDTNKSTRLIKEGQLRANYLEGFVSNKTDHQQ